MERYLLSYRSSLRLSCRSIEFCKREVKRQHVPYQKMIRALVDGYAERVGKYLGIHRIYILLVNSGASGSVVDQLQ